MIYLDNGATTFPKPDRVIRVMSEFMQNEMANPGRSGHKMAMETAKKIFMTRVKLAGMIGAKNPLQIVFTKNASEALNIAIMGVLKNGDMAITSVMEHNSVARPLHKLYNEGIIDLKIADSDDEGFVKLDEVINLIDDNTRLVCITHASNLLGSINDIAYLGKKIRELNNARGKKIIFMVDCAQTTGYVDINVEDMKIDILAGAGHKGLYGPTGTGFLYIDEKIKIEPIFVGGTGSMSESLVQPDMMPDALETGTLNAVGIVGLGEGLDYIKEKKQDFITKSYQELVKYTIEQLSNIEQVVIYGTRDEKLRSAVVCFNIKNMGSQEVVMRLSDEFDIATRGALHCAPMAHTRMGTLEQGMIRASFSSFNTKEDIDRLVDAIKKIAG